MSSTDSFIEEVTEEVRRDRLFAFFRKWAWLAVVLVLLIVGGAAFNEYRKAQQLAASQAFGDAVLSALNADQPPLRVAALRDIAAPGPQAQAVLDLLIAAELSADNRQSEAAETLRGVAVMSDVPEIYRQIANFKALTRSDTPLSVAERRIELEALAAPGSPLRLLSEEQLALLDIEAGDSAAALARLNRILEDAEVTAGLRRRAAQLIVALGGTPEGS